MNARRGRTGGSCRIINTMHEDGEPVPSSSSSAAETKRLATQTSSSTQSLSRQVKEAKRIRGNERTKQKRTRVTQETCGCCGASQGEYHAPVAEFECPYGVKGDCKKCGGVLGFVEGSETICTENRCKDPYNAESTRPILTSSTEVAPCDWITAITDKEGQLRSEYAKPGGRIAIITGVDGRRDGRPVECQEFYEADMGQKSSKFQLEELEKKKNIRIQCFDAGKLANTIRNMKSTPGSDFNDSQELKEFEDELSKFDPTVVVHAYCWSDNSIFNWVLLSRGIYAELNIRWDLSLITNGRCITMDQTQKDILLEVVKERPGVVFLWGSSGTGKTLVAVQAALTLAAHYEIKRQPWQLFICGGARNETQLNEEMKENYFSSVSGRDNVTFIAFNDLADKYVLNLEKIAISPVFINTLTTCIQEKNPDINNILFIDEVMGIEDENGIMDFSNLEVRKHINLVMAMSPGSENLMGQEYQVKAPKSPGILARQLLSPYRYAYWMLKFLQYWQYHRMYGDEAVSRLSNKNDVNPDKSQLPLGFIPTWIDGGWGENEASYTDMLEKVREILNNTDDFVRTMKEERAKMPTVEEKDEGRTFFIPDNSVRSVTVLFEEEECYLKEELSFCKSQNWRCRNIQSFTGCEDQASKQNFHCLVS